MNKDVAIKKAKETALKDKAEMDAFYCQHFLYAQKNNNNLLFTIKNHLYIENLIDKILIVILPNSKNIIKLTFAQKVDLLEAISSTTPNKIFVALRKINKLRNKFSHDIKYKIFKKDLDEISAILEISKHSSIKRQLQGIFQYLIGYLHATRSLCKFFPLGMMLLNFSANFKKDKFFTKRVFKKMYPWNSMKEILDAMEL